MGFSLIPKSVTLNDLILRNFTKFHSFGDPLHQSGCTVRWSEMHAISAVA